MTSVVHDEEQSQAEHTFLVDTNTVKEVISQTRAVNHNLDGLIVRTDTCVRRQNVLLGLLALLIVLQILHLALGVSMKELQQSAKAQLTAVDFGREDLLSTLKQAKRELAAMNEAMAGMRTQLNAAPTVTTDTRGRVSLEVTVDTPRKTTAEGRDQPPPDRLVIPLQPKQSRLSK